MTAQQFMRQDGRAHHQIRDISFERRSFGYALSSVLVRTGKTVVLCSVTAQPGVPKFLKGTQMGWLSAEYHMLPTATHERSTRDQYRGAPNGRALEIQRLISRSLRNCVALEQIGETTLMVDCDVLQADGGTRVAAINGGIVALYEALQVLSQRQKVPQTAFKRWITAVACGICQNQQLIDLSYEEDSQASSDCNFIFDEYGSFIEVQCSAEKEPLQKNDFDALLIKSQEAAAQILQRQKEIALAQ